MIIKSFNLNTSILTQQKSFYLIYGENQSLIDEIKEKIVREITKKKDFSIKKYYEDFLLNNNIIYQFLNSDNLFGEKELIVIHKTTDKILNLFDENNFKIKDKKIIFISDNLAKKSKIRSLAESSSDFACIACYNDTNEQLQSLLIEKLKYSKINISRELVNLIFEINSLNRQDINDAINKIQLIQKTSKISQEMLKEIFHSSSENSNFEIVNQCLLGNKKIIGKALSNIYAQGINFNEILSAFKYKTNKLLDILKFNKEMNLDQLIENFKPTIFWKEKKIIKDQLKKWSKEELEKLLNKILDTELRCKKNYEISSIILQNFLIKITTKECMEEAFFN